MPSFAKQFDTRLEGEESMADMFSSDDVQQVLQSVKEDARSRAQELIRIEIPNYIKHLTCVLEDAKNDKSSPLWKGHLESGPFVKDNVKLVFPQQGSNDGHPMFVVDGLRKLALENTPESRMAVPRMGHARMADEQPGMQWEGKLVSNDICDRLMDLVEVECEKSFEIGKELAHWVRLEVPTIEDGNNFGVDVQEEILRKIESVVSAAMKHHSLPKTHYDDRMHLAATWNKFPNLDDHAAAIASSDRFDFFLANSALKALRGNMAVLLTELRNNWAKVHNPKNSDGAGGVSGMY